jgi:hypothetical protein
MSAYSDYKHSAIDYDEFRSAMAWECRGDNDCGCSGCRCEGCVHYVKGTDTECDIPECDFEAVDYPDEY